MLKMVNEKLRYEGKLKPDLLDCTLSVKRLGETLLARHLLDDVIVR